MKRLLLRSAALVLAVSGVSPVVVAYNGETLLKRDAANALSRRSVERRAPVFKVPSRSGSDEKVFRTAVLSKDSWGVIGRQEFGMYEYPVSYYSSTSLCSNADIDPTGGAAYIGGGRYFSTSYASAYGRVFVNHYIIDANTGKTLSTSGGSETGIARDLAYDHTSGKLYGCFRGAGGSGYVLGTMDPYNTDAGCTAISALEVPLNALSVDRYGNLYAISRPGVLYAVDKGTGAMTKIGDTGLECKYQTTGTIDRDTDVFYYVTCNDEIGGLYAVDLKTAKAEKLYDMEDGEQLGGMYIPEVESAADVPGVVRDVTGSFDDMTFKGTISFTSPTATASGITASGELDYRIESNGVLLAEGKTEYGAKVDANVEVGGSGSYIFIITVSNGAGSSQEAYYETYVGYDCPMSVSKVDLRYDSGRFIVSWPASVEGAHGGLFNKDEVTYSVTRFPDEVKVAENIKGTTCEDVVAETSELIRYRYVVTPEYNGSVGNGTSSEEYRLGAIVPPYEVMFTSQAALADLTIVDANSDGRYWMMDPGEERLWLYPTSISKENDYIFSAPVKLEAGRLYKFVADMGVRYAAYGNKETFEALLSTSPSPEGCFKTLIEPLDISTDRDEYSVVFKVENTGKYYLAIHGVSEPDTYGIYAYGMSVRPDASADAPDAPVLSAVADIQGGMLVNIELTAPQRLINGGELGHIDRMELYRDDVLLTAYESPAPGAKYSYTDKDLKEGLHRYTAYAYNGAGAGKTVEALAYAGINLPGAPKDAVAKEQSDNRTVVIKWNAPDKDVNGCPINPDFISYTVSRFNGASLKWEPVATGIKGTSYSETLSISGGQVFMKYGVFAETSKGTNTTDVCAAPVIAVGDPYSMPYSETFGGTSLNGILGEDNENESASWQVWDQYDQDGDGRCLFYSGAIGKKGSMFTGKISVTGDKPMFSFWYWSIPTSPGEEIVVEINDGSGFRQVATTPMNRGGEEQHWERFACSLEEYVGKDIQVRLSYTILKYVLYVDNLRIYNAYEDNLSAHSMSVSNKMVPGSLNPVKVVVENTGENMSRAYNLDLYCNGTKVDSRQMSPLASGSKATQVFAYEITNIHPEKTEFHAVIDYEDGNPEDNVFAPVSTMVIHRGYPVVDDLSGSREGNDVVLEWSEPKLDGGSVTVTEDCEHYVPFSTGFMSSVLDNDYVGDWTMYDGDHEGSKGLAGFPHDNIASGAELSFIVFNPAELGIVVSAWQPRSGHQAFVCLCAPSGANDDWMISPELSGNAQTVKFYAKSVGDNYNEEFEFLYSTTGTDVNQFVKVDAVSKVPASWTEYTFDIPAGAKHFAIRCVSNRQFALFVDDITFERANPAAGLKLLGYNVYRDGSVLTGAPVSENIFREAEPEAHRYLVTAIYNRGESAASNEVLISKASSVGSVQAGNVGISGGRGVIVVEGARGETVAVFASDGKLVKRVKGLDVTRINVAKGLYIVKAGEVSAKVLVK